MIAAGTCPRMSICVGHYNAIILNGLGHCTPLMTRGKEHDMRIYRALFLNVTSVGQRRLEL